MVADVSLLSSAGKAGLSLGVAFRLLAEPVAAIMLEDADVAPTIEVLALTREEVELLEDVLLATGDEPSVIVIIGSGAVDGLGLGAVRLDMPLIADAVESFLPASIAVFRAETHCMASTGWLPLRYHLGDLPSFVPTVKVALSLDISTVAIDIEIVPRDACPSSCWSR